MICCNIHHNKYSLIKYNLYSYLFAGAYNKTKQIIHNIISTLMTVYHCIIILFASYKNKTKNNNIYIFKRNTLKRPYLLIRCVNS